MVQRGMSIGCFWIIPGLFYYDRLVLEVSGQSKFLAYALGVC